mmetsp:Transcript_104479/g.176591  ORF Transcript_104479/g.176591 Transcript_104479/m.176591 type:complete len:124 (+) Transcript_104479:125-496(+)
MAAKSDHQIMEATPTPTHGVGCSCTFTIRLSVPGATCPIRNATADPRVAGVPTVLQLDVPGHPTQTLTCQRRPARVLVEGEVLWVKGGVSLGLGLESVQPLGVCSGSGLQTSESRQKSQTRNR